MSIYLQHLTDTPYGKLRVAAEAELARLKKIEKPSDDEANQLTALGHFFNAGDFFRIGIAQHELDIITKMFPAENYALRADFLKVIEYKNNNFTRIKNFPYLDTALKEAIRKEKIVNNDAALAVVLVQCEQGGLTSLRDDEFVLLKKKFNDEKYREILEYYQTMSHIERAYQEAAMYSSVIQLQKFYDDFSKTLSDNETKWSDKNSLQASLYPAAKAVLEEIKNKTLAPRLSHEQVKVLTEVVESTHAAMLAPESFDNAKKYKKLVDRVQGKGTSDTRMQKLGGAMLILLGGLLIAAATAAVVAIAVLEPFMFVTAPAIVLAYIFGGLAIGVGIARIKDARKQERDLAYPGISDKCGLFHQKWQGVHKQMAAAPAPKI